MKDGTYRSLCCLCHCACGIVVQIRDGRLQSLQGDPDHPANRGRLCPKAAAMEELSRSPDRLAMPLKRTPSGFREISWEEAYDYAARRLSETLAKHGPGGLMRCSGAPMSYDARDGFGTLMGLCGSPNATGSSAYCMAPRVAAFQLTLGGKPEPDLDRADLILMWGSNPRASNRVGGFCAYDGVQQALDRARGRGASVVFIDPVRCESVREGDQWVPIRPGADAVLALAMLRHIINAGLYHREFVEQYTVGFEALAKHVQPYTPEMAQEKTGVPAQVILSLADRFARAPAATICDGNGLDMYCHTVYTVQALAALLGVTGRIDAPGGVVFLPFVPQAPMNRLNQADMALKHKHPLFRDVPFPAVKEALLAGDPDRPRAMVVHHANPALINGNSARTREALRKLDFLLVDDVFMTATAELADLVLPARTFFESYGYKAYTSFQRPFAALSHPLFDAPGQAKSVFEMEYQIGRRLGLGEAYPFHDDLSWIDCALAPSGITFQDLLERQMIFFDKPVQYEKYKTRGFNTPSKKMEFYSAKMEAHGYSPLPIPLDPAGGALDREDPAVYPLLLTSRRPGGFIHTRLHNIPAATSRAPLPVLWIGGEDARRYGVSSGDLVTVENPRGEGVFAAEVREEQQEGLLALDFGWGNPTDRGADLNRLTRDDVWDPVSGGNPNRLFRGRIKGVERR